MNEPETKGNYCGFSDILNLYKLLSGVVNSFRLLHFIVQKSEVSCLLPTDWLCRFPGCSKNRLKLEDGDVYSFCSREHKIEFGMVNNYIITILY